MFVLCDLQLDMLLQKKNMYNFQQAFQKAVTLLNAFKCLKAQILGVLFMMI